MTVPRRVLGMDYEVNPEEPVSAPTTYTARSVVLFAVVASTLVVAFGLVVVGAWAQWGTPIGLFVLGLSLLAGLLLASAWPAKRGPQ